MIATSPEILSIAGRETWSLLEGQQHGDESYPAAECVHDDAAGEIVELGAEKILQPSLEAEPPVPRDAFEQRIDDCDKAEGRGNFFIGYTAPYGVNFFTGAETLAQASG